MISVFRRRNSFYKNDTFEEKSESVMLLNRATFVVVKSNQSIRFYRSGDLSSLKSYSDPSLSNLSLRDEYFKCSRHALSGYSKMETFFLQNQLTDITLKAGTIPNPKIIISFEFCCNTEFVFFFFLSGERVIQAHKVVLCAASDYFSAMFMNNLRESTQKEVIFNEINGDILQKLIHYCYIGMHCASYLRDL